MWELIYNGLNIVGSLSGIGSFASGFSMDRNINSIKKSLDVLETNYSKILNASKINQTILEEVAPIINNYKNHNIPNLQNISINQIQNHLIDFRKDLSTSLKEILESTLHEMRTILDSTHLTEGKRIHAPKNLLYDLTKNPFNTGINQFWDISESGLWNLNKRRIINRNISPITWSNPLTGQMFLGEIPLTNLYKYGMNVQPPNYRNVVDGCIYSDRYGLYLPSYYVE